MGLKPLKKFGQNYLVDKNIINKMIASLNLNSSDLLLEIGPGKGSITEELIKHVNKLYAIEIDTRVTEILNNKFPTLELYTTDFLKFNFSDILNEKEKIKIIGNIPFNLTGSILFKLIENRKYLEDIVLLMPLDLAKKLVAKKRTKDYGILTILFSYFSTSKIIQKVSRNVFLPKPNIEAAIVHIRFDKLEIVDLDDKLFIKIVKAAFGNRRKTLNNSLRNSIFSSYNYSCFDLLLKKRAEELEVSDFIRITNSLKKQQCQKKMK